MHNHDGVVIPSELDMKKYSYNDIILNSNTKKLLMISDSGSNASLT